MQVSLTSWNGHNINDGTNYTSIVSNKGSVVPAFQPSWTYRQSGGPLLSGGRLSEHSIILEITIKGAASAYNTRRDELKKWFDIDDSVPHALIGTATSSWVIYARPVSITENYAELGLGVVP